MDRCSALLPLYDKRPRADRRRAISLRPLMWLGLLVLGGCAGSGAAPVTNTAALAQRAYASNGTIRSVSDALDQRLDLMLAERMVALPR
jgi:hypothetical protein